jgi:hypothetical protein
MTLNEWVKTNTMEQFEELKETNFRTLSRNRWFTQTGKISMFTNPTSSNTQTRKPYGYYFAWIQLKFLKLPLATFWTQLLIEFWELSKQALKILIPFFTTHLYRTEFSFIISIMINNHKGTFSPIWNWTYSSIVSVTDTLYIEKQLHTGKLVHCSDKYCIIFCVTMLQY